MRQTIVNTMYLQTYKHTKKHVPSVSFVPGPSVTCFHITDRFKSTDPIYLQFRWPLLPLLPNGLHRPYIPVYIYKISYSQFQLLVCVWRSNRFVNILSHFFPQIFFFHGTEIKHIHVYSYSPYIYKRIILIKTGLTLIDVIKNVFNFEEHNRKIF